jgi:hypothetical protein
MVRSTRAGRAALVVREFAALRNWVLYNRHL